MTGATLPAPRQRFRPQTLIPYAVLTLATLPILILYVWLTYSSFFPAVEGLRPVGAFTLENWRFRPLAHRGCIDLAFWRRGQSLGL